MKERPILFSAAMVRALLVPTKTQTRRVVKSFKHLVPALGVEMDCVKDIDGHPSRLDLAPADWEICPYGVPGDRLWVRETWALMLHADGEHVHYRADGNVPKDHRGNPLRWRPSIHMPRAASRITLEVTGVRVERLHAISAADAIAEGVPISHVAGDADLYKMVPHRKLAYEDGKVIDAVEYAGPAYNRCPIRAYEALWDSINGTREGCGWDANPWVWCVSFRRIA